MHTLLLLIIPIVFMAIVFFLKGKTAGYVALVSSILSFIVSIIIAIFLHFNGYFDEFNQSWGIYIEGIDVYDFELLLYNRWGQIIWECHDPTEKWDGTYGGKYVENGTYTWIIRTKDLVNDAKYVYNGHVNVLR